MDAGVDLDSNTVQLQYSSFNLAKKSRGGMQIKKCHCTPVFNLLKLFIPLALGISR